MRAIVVNEFGGIDSMKMGTALTPKCMDNEVLLKVAAIGLNRADILQRKGLYAPPTGASEILGLEVSGVVVEKGDEVEGVKVGDRRMALLAGGAYAEYVTCNIKHTLPIPESIPMEEASAIPEVFITAFQALCAIGNLKDRETVLIHAAASGVGTSAIQIAKHLGAKVIATASLAKHEACKSLGADYCIDYKKEDFAEQVLHLTNNSGVDLIIDFVGGTYFQKNIKCIKLDGRMVMLGFLGGAKTNELNLAYILRNRIQITGTTLRARSEQYKSKLISDFREQIYPALIKKEIYPVIHEVLDWNDFKKAHQIMENNENVGKIILKVN